MFWPKDSNRPAYAAISAAEELGLSPQALVIPTDLQFPHELGSPHPLASNRGAFIT